MKKSSLIGNVCELLDIIRPLKQPADVVVKDFFRARHYLGSKDRRFISETLYDILRNYKLIRFFAEIGIQQAGIQYSHIPSLLLYISYSTKIKNEDVQEVLSAVGGMLRISFPKIESQDIVHAIFRSQVPENDIGSFLQRLALLHSFPEFIVEEWVERFGETVAANLCAAMNKPAPTTVRVNALKTTVESCRDRLAEEGVTSERTLLSPSGLILERRVNVQALQSFKDGWFEMQDEGSQLLSLLLEPRPGSVVVDACAGGGGKTLHLAALMQNEGEIHAIDIDEKRLSGIRARLHRAGVSIATLHQQSRENTAALNIFADGVLVDAPCSGIGTFRRNPAAKLSVNENFVSRIAATQSEILATYASLVKQGGRLVYSTCTLLRKENEQVVEGFLASHPEFELVSASDILRQQHLVVESSSPYLILLPHVTGTDGFFAAVMNRRK